MFNFEKEANTITQIEKVEKFLTLQQKVEGKFVQLVKSDQYPITVKEGINEVMDIIAQEKSIIDLYPEVLAEVPISQSIFHDMGVQYYHGNVSPHRNLRQAVMEMQDRLNALYAAKTGQKKAILKLERLKLEIENIENELSKAETDYEIRRWNLTKAEKEVDYEEANRGVKDSGHFIKDALLKVTHQRKLVEKFKAQVEKSGLSYEESEVVYFCFFFTQEAERQLRLGSMLDRGTLMAISQLPDAIRLKVLNNISYLRSIIFDDNFDPDSDFICKTHSDVIAPIKTGDMEFEGVKIADMLGIEPIKILAKNKN